MGLHPKSSTLVCVIRRINVFIIFLQNVYFWMRHLVLRLKWAARALLWNRFKFKPCFLFRDKYLQIHWICQDLNQQLLSMKFASPTLCTARTVQTKLQNWLCLTHWLLKNNQCGFTDFNTFRLLPTCNSPCPTCTTIKSGLCLHMSILWAREEGNTWTPKRMLIANAASKQEMVCMCV